MHRRQIFVPGIACAALLACSAARPAPVPEPEPEPEPQPEPSPAPSLTASEDVAPGPECPAGGVRVTTGTDDNGSGTLEPDEIGASSLVCRTNVVFHGDLVISNDFDTAQLRGITEIDGSLRIVARDLVSLDLSLLGRIDGDFTYNTDSPRLEAPHLFAIAGDLEIDSYATFRWDIVLPALTDVGGGIDLFGRIDFGAPLLTHVAFVNASRRVEGAANEVGGLALPALSIIDHELAIAGSEMGELDLPALRTVGSIVIVNNVGICTSRAQELALRTGAMSVIEGNKKC